MVDAAPVAQTAPTTQSNPVPTSNESPKENSNAEPGEIEPWRKVKHKYKAAGQEYEVDYDELVKRAEKAHGAEKRLAEATKKEKEILGRLDKLKTTEDFNDVVALLGDDKRARELAEKYIWDKMKYDELPEDKKEALELKRQNEELQNKLKQIDEVEAEKTKAAQTQKANEIVDREIKEAIAEAEKAGLSPEDVPEYIERLIDEMIVHLEYIEECEKEGREVTKSPLSPRDVLRKIQDNDSKKIAASLKKLSAKDLKSMLSKEQLEQIRAEEIEELYSSAPTRNRTADKADKKNSSDKPVDPFKDKREQPRKPNTKDWFTAMEKRYERK